MTTETTPSFERTIQVTEINWKGEDGCFYRKLVLEDGRVIYVEILDKSPFVLMEEK